jgi:hypothetical protein
MLRSHWVINASSDNTFCVIFIENCDSSLKATIFLSSVVHNLYLFAHANRFCFIEGVNNCFLIGFLAYRQTPRSLHRTVEASLSIPEVNKSL